jgi:hypothetical protein
VTVRIKGVRKASVTEWDRAWQSCDYATYFHSRQWGDIWHAYSNGRIRAEPRFVSFTDGKTAIIPLSCSLSCYRFVKSCSSSPAGTFGGWITADALEVGHARLLTDYMLTKCGDLDWVVNPYDENVFKAGVDRSDHETDMLDLSVGFDNVLRQFERENIRAIRKAQNLGIAIRLGDTLEDWRHYFTAYEESLSRWKHVSSRYEWRLFEEIFNRQSPHVQLWLATCGNSIVSGALCFYAKRHVVYWHGASLKEYFSYRPVHLLLHEIIKDACEKGYKWFDFNPSGGHAGVRAFKKTFGTKALSCPVIRARPQKSLLTKGVETFARLLRCISRRRSWEM